MKEQIKAMLKRKGITQKELATRLGVSAPTLSVKMNLDNWRENDLYKIAEVCGCKYVGEFID